MRSTPRVGAAGILVWGAAALWLSSFDPRFARTTIDVQRAVHAGPQAWPALAEWGLHCRWLGDAGAARQRQADGCGPAVLDALLATRGWHPAQQLLWSICRRPRGGTTLGTLARAARTFGYPCQVAWSGSLRDLEPPAIVHLQRGHFVLLEARDAAAAHILDPACGRLAVPWAVLEARSSGAVLRLGAQALPEPRERT